MRTYRSIAASILVQRPDDPSSSVLYYIFYFMFYTQVRHTDTIW